MNVELQSAAPMNLDKGIQTLYIYIERETYSYSYIYACISMCIYIYIYIYPNLIPGRGAEVRRGAFDRCLKHDTGHWQGEQTLETQSWHSQSDSCPHILHMTPITSDV